MKKIYLEPQIDVVKIQTSGMLAVSGFEESIDSSFTGDGSDALTREFDTFDDWKDDSDDISWTDF